MAYLLSNKCIKKLKSDNYCYRRRLGGILFLQHTVVQKYTADAHNNRSITWLLIGGIYSQSLRYEYERASCDKRSAARDSRKAVKYGNDGESTIQLSIFECGGDVSERLAKAHLKMW